MKIQAYILAFLFLVMACKKDTASDNQAPASPALIFVKTKQSNNTSVLNKNIYAETGEIKTRISYKNFSSGLIGAQTDYLYEGGNLIQVDDMVDYSSSTATAQYAYSRVLFDYTNGHIVQRNNYLKTGDQYDLKSFAVFEYNAQGLPQKETRYSADGAFTGYSVYEYAADGNVAISSEFGINNNSATPVLMVKYTYLHDLYNNPYKKIYNLIENIPFSVNTNNIIQTTVINYNSNGSPQTSVSKTTYTYNEKAYPVYMNENGNEFLLEYK
ncbi:MAG: hypothetical protein QM802_07515 [Agriterribacter sp.]